MPTINELQAKFSITDDAYTHATVTAGAGDLPMVIIKNKYATAHIYLHGAHLTHFQPHDSQPVLWLSKKSRFQKDAPIRGGVPICWPWFGAHESNASAPAHGFARHRAWTVEVVRAEKDGSTTIQLSLRDDEISRNLWPHAFQLLFTVVIGKELDMQLTTKNCGENPFNYSEALHTYFAISDIHAIRITGLQGTTYADKVDHMQHHCDHQPIAFNAETDRVYLNTTATCTINDPGHKRAISIAKSGSLATVVWNPWIAKSVAMADFGDDEWPHMVCLETANALQHTRTLSPGSSHTMQANIAVKAPAN